MGEGDTAAGDWLDCFSLQLGSVVFLLESIYFHLFIIEMNTITINENNLVNICGYIYIYIKKILFHADTATGELALWSNRSITLVESKFLFFL